MKSFLFGILFLFTTFFTFAQHETLFGKARVVGGFGGTITEFGLNNSLQTSYGGGGGIVIGGAFLGAYGLGSVDLGDVLEGNNIDKVELGHGGLWLGYTYQPYKLLHLFSSAKVGWGAVNIDTNNFDPFDGNSDQVFVLTPELGLELNIFRWFRVAGGLGYRWVNGTDGGNLYENEDFSGLVTNLTLRFGWFGNRRF
jgi:hypothetical protein